MDTQAKYMQFPVYLLAGIHSNHNSAFDKMLSIGAYLFSTHIEVNAQHATGQLIYCYSQRKKSLTRELIRYLDKIDGSNINGEMFILEHGVNFYIEYNNNFSFEGHDILLLELLKQQPDILKAATEWYRLIQAFNYFNIKLVGLDIEAEYKAIRTIKLEGQPLCMVKRDLIWEYYNGKKSERQMAQFAAFAALKSILGKRKCIITNKNHIVARMFGYSSIKSLDDPFETIHPLYPKYSKRYNIDKLLEELEFSWNLKTMSAPGLHGFYVSFTMDYEQLALLAVKRMKKTKRDELHEMKQKARMSAKRQLK